MPEGDGKFLEWWKANKPSWLTVSRGWGFQDVAVIAELAREAYRAGESSASPSSSDGTTQPLQSV